MANPPARSKCGTAPSPEDRQGRSWCSRVCRSIAVRTLVAARLMLGERAGRRGCGGAGGMGSRRRAVRRSLRVAVVARGAYGRPAQDRMQLEARREQGTRAGGERASLRRLGRGRPSSRFLLQPRSSTTPCQSFAPPLGPARHHRQSRHPRPPDRSPQEEDEATTRSACSPLELRRVGRADWAYRWAKERGRRAGGHPDEHLERSHRPGELTVVAPLPLPRPRPRLALHLAGERFTDRLPVPVRSSRRPPRSSRRRRRRRSPAVPRSATSTTRASSTCVPLSLSACTLSRSTS